MDNPEKLAILGTQDTSHRQTQQNTVCFGHDCTETNTNNVNQT